MERWQRCWTALGRLACPQSHRSLGSRRGRNHRAKQRKAQRHAPPQATAITREQLLQRRGVTKISHRMDPCAPVFLPVAEAIARHSEWAAATARPQSTTLALYTGQQAGTYTWVPPRKELREPQLAPALQTRATPQPTMPLGEAPPQMCQAKWSIKEFMDYVVTVRTHRYNDVNDHVPVLAGLLVATETEIVGYNHLLGADDDPYTDTCQEMGKFTAAKDTDEGKAEELTAASGRASDSVQAVVDTVVAMRTSNDDDDETTRDIIDMLDYILQQEGGEVPMDKVADFLRDTWELSAAFAAFRSRAFAHKFYITDDDVFLRWLNPVVSKRCVR